MYPFDSTPTRGSSCHGCPVWRSPTAPKAWGDPQPMGRRGRRGPSDGGMLRGDRRHTGSIRGEPMATIPSLPSRDDVLRLARNTTDITAQLLDTAGNVTRIAMNTFDPRDGSGTEVLRVLRETTAELAEA